MAVKKGKAIDTMELYEAISRRRTVREFRDEPVPEHVVRRVLAAGLKAPSNAHLKHWEFVLLRDREKRARVAAESLKARNMEKGEGMERFTEPALKEVYRRSLPLQLTMMLEAPELLVVCYRMKPLASCRTLFELNPLASA